MTDTNLATCVQACARTHTCTHAHSYFQVHRHKQRGSRSPQWQTCSHGVCSLTSVRTKRVKQNSLSSFLPQCWTPGHPDDISRMGRGLARDHHGLSVALGPLPASWETGYPGGNAYLCYQPIHLYLSDQESFPNSIGVTFQGERDVSWTSHCFKVFCSTDPLCGGKHVSHLLTSSIAPTSQVVKLEKGGV